MSDAPAPAETGQAPQSAAQAIQSVPDQSAPTQSQQASDGMWYASVKADHHEYIKNKGWSSMDAALDSYVNLEKMRGVPESELVRIPSPEDLDAYNDVYNRLGRPESPDGYNIEGLSDDDYGKWYRETIHEIGLNDRQAKVLQEKHDAYVEQQQKVAEESFVIQAQNEMKELQHEWGSAHDRNMQYVKEGAEKLGWNEEELSQLERTIGTKRLLQTMAAIGESLGESPYHGTESSAADGVMTRESARAAYNELNNDPDFRKQLLSNDLKIRQAAINKRNQLSKLAFD